MRLALDAGGGDLAQVQEELRAFLAVLPLTAAERSAVHVAVLEAVLNAVRHAHHVGQRAGTLDLEVVAGRIVATVTDHGPCFDPASCPDPLAPERTGLSHGRGLLLMRALMDDVDFTFPPGGGTRVTLCRAIPPAAPPGAQPAQGATHMRPTVQVKNGTGKMVLNGQLDSSVQSDFKEVSEELLNNPEVRLIQIDFEKVPFLDTSALGMLMLLKQRTEDKKKSLELINCGESVKQIFEIAHFDAQFTIR
ncbi:ATP-binding protein [Streptomyces sp. NPDC001414]